MTAVDYAIWKNNRELAASLLSHSAQTFHQSSFFHVLEQAGEAGYEDIALKLIELKADVNAKNEKGETALEIAKKLSLEKVVKILKGN